MRILRLIQGTPEWKEARRTHKCSSDLPAAQGLSHVKTRTDLLREKALGIEKEYDVFTLELFERGHKAEAALRPVIEQMIGEELYPQVGESDCGKYLASFDGITMDGAVGYEHKVWNQDDVQFVEDGVVPPCHVPQVAQQFFVGNELERIVFVMSDGTPEKMRYAIIKRSDFEKHIANVEPWWAQFDRDVEEVIANPEKVEVISQPTPNLPDKLPPLAISIEGKVTSSNLTVYRDKVRALVAGINTDLQTDQDFADAAKLVTFCEAAEKEIDAVKRKVLAQAMSVNEVFDTLDKLREEMRQKRLQLDKLVESKKEDIKLKLISTASSALNVYVQELDATVLNLAREMPFKPKMPVIQSDFRGVIRGKKTVTSVREAVNNECARAKIDADRICRDICINIASFLAEVPYEYRGLFADMTTIALKPNEDFVLLMRDRVRVAKEAEAKKLEDAKLEERNRLAAANDAPRTFPNSAPQGTDTAGSVNPIANGQGAAPAAADPFDDAALARQASDLVREFGNSIHVADKKWSTIRSYLVEFYVFVKKREKVKA